MVARTIELVTTEVAPVVRRETARSQKTRKNPAAANTIPTRAE